jgi:GNAT superfamily N-acetyltransferase
VLSAVRTMTPGDISSAMELSAFANWNQAIDDWRRVMQLNPKGCRCIEDAGSVVATASLLPYGNRLAWIGMVLTRPEYRRRGLAKKLMEDAIAIAERGGIRTLKLDATDEGRPLYESLGFVVEQPVERWGREGAKSPVTNDEPVASASMEKDLDAEQISADLLHRDAESFGVAREKLLESLRSSGRCTATADGYVFSRPGRVAQYLGPCMADSEAAARQLIAEHLQGHSCNWYWDLLPANSGAVRCAEGLGFTRRRTLQRMRRGEKINTNDAKIYAIAGFELG